MNEELVKSFDDVITYLEGYRDSIKDTDKDSYTLQQKLSNEIGLLHLQREDLALGTHNIEIIRLRGQKVDLLSISNGAKVLIEKNNNMTDKVKNAHERTIRNIRVQVNEIDNQVMDLRQQDDVIRSNSRSVQLKK